MENLQPIKPIRQKCNTVGLTMLAYYGIMNVAVTVVLILDLIVYIALHLQSFNMNDVMQHIMDSAVSNGWGYLLAMAAGGLIVLLWKGLGFWKTEVFAAGKKMTAGAFFQLLCMFVAVQALLQAVAPLQEWILNLFGLSAMAAMEMASISATGFSMFLYLSFLGPIAEELLFRGLVLRMLQPYGKQFAILASALVFGLFHGNVIQIPFAFLIGVVLGYVTVEYSIVWAIVLHIFNNFVLSDLLTRVSGLIPGLGEMLFLVIIIAAAIGTVIILILRRREAGAYLKENRVDPLAAKAFFTAPAVLIFIGLMLLMSLLSITAI